MSNMPSFCSSWTGIQFFLGFQISTANVLRQNASAEHGQTVDPFN
jgi:hypothetical protein